MTTTAGRMTTTRRTTHRRDLQQRADDVAGAGLASEGDARTDGPVLPHFPIDYFFKNMPKTTMIIFTVITK